MTKLTRIISMNYDSKEGTKSGLIILNLRYIPEDNKLDCLGAEFSDSEIEAHLRNTSILTEIYSEMINEFVYENQSEKEELVIR
jgi:hypothetical protein